MATSQTILPWGRHKGEPIEEASTDYLKSVAWAITDQKSDFFSQPRNRDLVEAMLAELLNRDPSEANAVRDAKIALADADKNRGALPVASGNSKATCPIEDVGAIAADLQLQTQTPVQAPKVWMVEIEAIDEFTKNIDLLKVFLGRVDKSLGLYAWMLETGQEAHKYGVEVPLPDDVAFAEQERMEYAGLTVDVIVSRTGRSVRSITKTV